MPKCGWDPGKCPGDLPSATGNVLSNRYMSSQYYMDAFTLPRLVTIRVHVCGHLTLPLAHHSYEIGLQVHGRGWYQTADLESGNTYIFENIKLCLITHPSAQDELWLSVTVWSMDPAAKQAKQGSKYTYMYVHPTLIPVVVSSWLFVMVQHFNCRLPTKCKSVHVLEKWCVGGEILCLKGCVQICPPEYCTWSRAIFKYIGYII